MLRPLHTRITLAALGIVVVGTLSACASGGGTDEPTATATATTTVTATATPAPSDDDTAAASPSTGTGGSGGDDGGSSGGGTAAGSGSGTTAENTCVAADLTGSIVAGGGGAAGSVEVNIALRNTGTTTCSLQGWPGVSFVGGGDGAQVGAAADLDRSAPHAAVSLTPGTTVTAPLKIVQAANIPSSECSPTQVDGFRVYPPGSKTAVFIPDTDYTACQSMKVGLLSVKAFVQG